MSFDSKLQHHITQLRGELSSPPLIAALMRTYDKKRCRSAMCPINILDTSDTDVFLKFCSKNFPEEAPAEVFPQVRPQTNLYYSPSAPLFLIIFILFHF